MTVGVVVVAFGPKDIPIIARGLGKLTGQAVGKERSQHSLFENAHFFYLFLGQRGTLGVGGIHVYMQSPWNEMKRSLLNVPFLSHSSAHLH